MLSLPFKPRQIHLTAGNFKTTCGLTITPDNKLPYTNLLSIVDCPECLLMVSEDEVKRLTELEQARRSRHG